MAENEPNIPGGAVPPKPSEAKVQPKKETVRISLPPKPTASPTIKLPTLPGAPAPGGVTTAPTMPATGAPPPPPSAAGAPPPPPRAPTAAPGSRLAGAPSASAAKTAAPASSVQKGAAASAAPQRAVSPAKPAATVGVFDKVLAIVAFVASGAALGTVIFLMTMLNDLLVKYVELAEKMPKL